MNLLRGYIQYLRDVSRKIVNRAGFENVLPAETRKKKNYYYNLDNYSNIVELFKDDEYSIPKSERQFAEYVKTVNNFYTATVSLLKGLCCELKDTGVILLMVGGDANHGQKNQSTPPPCLF